MTITTVPAMTRAEFAAEASGTFRGMSVCESGDGRTFLAYGHVPLHVFMGAVEDHDRTRGIDPDEAPIVSARHVWAVATSCAPHWDLSWADDVGPDTPGAFALTVGHR